MNRIARRSGAVSILVLLLMGGFIFFLVEYAMNASGWVMKPSSPHVYEKPKYTDSAVTDRDGLLLLQMQEGQRSYFSDPAVRMATLHWVGDREGNIRIPAYHKNVADYDFLNGLYTYGGVQGNDVTMTLTVSAQLQVAALEALGDHKGTVAVYNYKTGEILCAVTTPTYDPDNVPDIQGDPVTYEGAYLNRFTQVSYTPGSIFKIVTLAAALDSIPEVESQTFTCTGRWDDTEKTVTCERAHGKQTLKEAFCNSCNCTFATLARQMGAKTLGYYVEKFRVTQPLEFDGITTASGNFTPDEYYITLGWRAIGQDTDQINPCAYMQFMGAIAGGGRAAMPYVVESAADGKTNYRAEVSYSDSVMSRELAQKLQEYMEYTVNNKYGSENFPGMTVCAKTGTAEKDGDQASNAMFSGFVMDDAYPLAFIVCVEEGGYGAVTGVPVASQILQACKAYLDSNG